MSGDCNLLIYLVNLYVNKSHTAFHMMRIYFKFSLHEEQLYHISLMQDMAGRFSVEMKYIVPFTTRN